MTLILWHQLVVAGLEVAGLIAETLGFADLAAM